MATNLNLQVLAGDYVKTALIVEWRVKEGDAVKKGDALLSCETAKVTVDIESPCDGIIEKILFEEDSDVDIAETIAIIGDGNGVAESIAPAAVEQSAEPSAVVSSKDDSPHERKVLITPVAKKAAAAHNVDLDRFLTRMKELGVKKARKEDVMEYLDNMPKEPAGKPIRGMRKAIAGKMKKSKQDKPHVTHMIDVDADHLFEVKKYLGQKYPGEKYSLTGLIAAAVSKALREHPEFNATVTEETICVYDQIHMGIAVDVADGLLVPVLCSCDQKTGREICLETGILADGARQGTLPPGAYTGGTFTITNVGTSGVKYFTPIINEPEAAILGVGSVRRELALDGEQVVEKKVLGLCLSFDHAAVDGAPAARFLQTIKEYLEHMYLLGF